MGKVGISNRKVDVKRSIKCSTFYILHLISIWVNEQVGFACNKIYLKTIHLNYKVRHPHAYLITCAIYLAKEQFPNNRCHIFFNRVHKFENALQSFPLFPTFKTVF